jgi:hypothetical protein
VPSLSACPYSVYGGGGILNAKWRHFQNTDISLVAKYISFQNRDVILLAKFTYFLLYLHLFLLCDLHVRQWCSLHIINISTKIFFLNLHTMLLNLGHFISTISHYCVHCTAICATVILWASAGRHPFQMLTKLSDISTEDFMIFLVNARIVFRMGHDCLLPNSLKCLILLFLPPQIIVFLFILLCIGVRGSVSG